LNAIKMVIVVVLLWPLFYQNLYAADPVVEFDQQKKNLTIQVEGVSMQYLLGMISRKTGYEVLTTDGFDLERKISVDMNGPIHQLLPRILQDMSVVVVDGGKEGLSMISILPQGDDQSAYLSSGKAVRSVVIEASDNPEKIEKNERRRDIGREAWKLKKEKEREIRKQRRIESNGE